MCSRSFVPVLCLSAIVLLYAREVTAAERVEHMQRPGLPLTTAADAAGSRYAHLLTQRSTRVHAQLSPGEKVLAAGAIGFSVGFIGVMLSDASGSNEKFRFAAATGVSLGVLAAAVTYVVLTALNEEDSCVGLRRSSAVLSSRRQPLPPSAS